MAKQKDSWTHKLCRSGIGKWCGGHSRSSVIGFIKKHCKHVCRRLGSYKWLEVGIRRPCYKSSEPFSELCVLLGLNYEHYVLALAQVSWEFWPFIHLFLCHMRAPSQLDWQEKFLDREEICQDWHEIAPSWPEGKFKTGKNWPLNAENVGGQFGALLFGT